MHFERMLSAAKVGGRREEAALCTEASREVTANRKRASLSRHARAAAHASRRDLHGWQHPPHMIGCSTACILRASAVCTILMLQMKTGLQAELQTTAFFGAPCGAAPASISTALGPLCMNPNVVSCQLLLPAV